MKISLKYRCEISLKHERKTKIKFYKRNRIPIKKFFKKKLVPRVNDIQPKGSPKR